MTAAQEQPEVPAVPRDLVAHWAGRWRYPSLLALLSRTGEDAALGADAAADAVADGLARPMGLPEHAASALIERGEFAAARQVPGWVDAEGAVEAAVAEARARLGRRLDRLARRAVRAGLADRPPEGLEPLLEVRSADADAVLADWQGRLEQAERRRVAELDDRLCAAVEEDGWTSGGTDAPGQACADWEQAVRNCLRQGELAAAERLLDAGPSPDAVGGPLTVPGQRIWPWADVPVREVLAWYAGSVGARPEFGSQWLPDDESGTALVAALAELHLNVSAETVRGFANALDTHLGADAARHQVEEYGGGFVTWLSGVADYQRIPQLALPRKLRLYVGPDGWSPEVPEKDRPAAWLVLRMQATARQRELVPPGVAVLDVRTVLQLAAPDRHGRATSRGHRTVNLLRSMGRGLRVVDIVGRQPLPDDRSGPAAHPHEEHEDLAWWLDLLGVRSTDAAVDMLLYDTDGHPVALRAALAGLIPDTDRPYELTSEALEEWRADPDAQAAFHDTVVEQSFLGSDREAAAALRSVLLLVRGEPDLALSPEDVAAVLGPSASTAGSLPMELGAALSRVAAAGFLRQDPGSGRYRWNGPGLAALLTGPDPRRVESLLDQDLRELYDRRDRSEESAVLGLLEVRESYAHTRVNRLAGAADAIRRTLERDDLSEGGRANLHGALRAVEESQLAEARARDPKRLYDDLNTKEPLDLRSELESHCLGLLAEAPPGVAVDFVPGTDREVVVWASHQLLKMAVGNLLDNALREVGTDGRIRVTLGLLPRGRGGAGSPVARIDVEDSGPGVAECWLPFLNGLVGGPPPTAPKGSGRGVAFARNFIVDHNGTLRFLGRSHELRGAHVRIELPVTGAPAG
ncbi:sensor histidine kinase [Streptacidiphilus sp. ASG 303]|uniref:sensor histidine kinase n=1 Tax=Streptacidiphilus sp. ASG 303 TaxID=2896847 RepID=UPI001E4674CA|nr:sensor histidine kinase [Streptacidiphilus sp. ASG 303]MCD0483024.1 sensor histidine kinase [Streptacidiphilus sp. ASG 303]